MLSLLLTVLRVKLKLEYLLEELLSINSTQSIPIHWNFSSNPYLENRNHSIASLITEIKTRISSRNDVIIPTGYRGAVNPLLKLWELKKELSWCIQNPWDSGIKDLFKLIPDIIIPNVPDLFRKESLLKYWKKR